MVCSECQDEAVVPARDLESSGPADVVIDCDHGDVVPVILPRMPIPPLRMVGHFVGKRAVIRGVSGPGFNGRGMGERRTRGNQ